MECYTDLLWGWIKHEALVAPPGTAVWDLAVPVYVGNLDKPLEQDNFSVMFVQVKFQRKGTFKGVVPPLISEGGIPDRPGLAAPQSAAALGMTPIILWLEMQTHTKPLQESSVAVRCVDHETELARILGQAKKVKAKVVKNTEQFWTVRTTSFDHKLHPALKRALGEPTG